MTSKVTNLETLIESLEQESVECFKTATMNPSPTGEAFHVQGIVLQSLARRIKAKHERLTVDAPV